MPGVRLAAAIGVLLLAGAAGAGGAPARSPDELVFASVRDHDALELFSMREDGTGLRRLTRQHPVPLDPEWSPDGKLVAFEAELPRSGGRTSIWVVGADGRNPRRLVAHGRDPTWAPHSRVVAFAVGRSLKAVSLNGRVRTVVTLRVPPRRAALVIAAAPSWSPDGRRLLFERRRLTPPTDSGEIYVVGASGGGLARIAEGGQPAWSPDGRRIAFARPAPQSSSEDRYGQLWVADADGTDQGAVPHWDGGRRPLEAPAWSPDGMMLVATEPDLVPRAYIVELESGEARPLPVGGVSWVMGADWLRVGRVGLSRLETGQLVTLDPDGGNPAVVYTGGRRDSEPAWAPDGVSLAFTRRGPVFSDEVSVLVRERGQARTLARRGLQSDWAPDGRRVALLVTGAGCEPPDSCRGLAVVDRAGKLLRGLGRLYEPDWSPDGRRIAAAGRLGRLTAVELSSARALTLTRPSDSRGRRRVDTMPDYSPDGRLITFVRIDCPDYAPSQDALGCRHSLYLLAASGGTPKLFLRNATSPAWSPDGRKIAFVRTRGGNADIYVVGADGRGLRRVTTNPGADVDPAWRPRP